MNGQTMNVGAQLWLFNAITDESEMDSILSLLSESGYPYVETMFGRPPVRRESLDRIGMSCYATHFALSSNASGGDVIAHCHQMGAEVACVSGLLQWHNRSAGDYRKSCDALNVLGSQFLAEGVSLQYHNHDFEFDNVEGETTGMDLLLAGLNPDAISLCFDAGWASKAGHDPVSFMRHQGQLIRTVHLRDFRDGTSVALGAGDIDLTSIVAALEHLPALQAVLVEQDPGTEDPVGDMIRSRQYLIESLNL